MDSYCHTKVWMVKPVYQHMTLSPWLGAAGMIILWHIRSPLLTLIFISVAFSTRPLGIRIHFQTLLSPLLKVPRMVLLSSLLWWELGTSLPGPGLGEWLSFWRVTSKQFWFWTPRNRAQNPIPNFVNGICLNICWNLCQTYDRLFFEMHLTACLYIRHFSEI